MPIGLLKGQEGLRVKNKKQPQVKIIIGLLLIGENPPNTDCF